MGRRRASIRRVPDRPRFPCSSVRTHSCSSIGEMQPDFSQIGPFLFAALVVFAIYRRFGGRFWGQPLRPARMTVRMVLLTALVCLLLPAAFRSAQFLTAELTGAVLGIGLGVW